MKTNFHIACLSLIVGATIIMPLLVSAQNEYPPITNYTPKDYNDVSKTKIESELSNDGFLTPENTCAIQDQRGVMYFGNANGVIEYDGEEWRFTMVKKGKRVRSLAKDSNGVIYVGSFNEFGYLKADQQNRLKYVSLSDKLPKNHLDFTDIWNIECGENGVYFQALQKVFLFNNDTLRAYSPKKTSIHTAYLHENKLFARVREKGLCILNEQTGDYELIQGGDSLANYGVFNVLPHPSGKALVLTQEKGLWVYGDGKISKLSSNFADDINAYKIFGGIRLQSGNYALYSFTEGVIVIKPNGKVIHQITKRNGLRVNDVKSIFQDRDKNIWLPLGNGIAQVNYSSPLSFYQEKAGIYGNVQSIKRYQGQLFVGTSSGLFYQNPNTDANLEFSSVPQLKTQVWDLDLWEGTLLISTSAGVYQWKDGSLQLKWDQNTNTLFVDSIQKRIITAGSDGIYSFYNSSWQPNFSFAESMSRMMNIVKVPDKSKVQYFIGSVNIGVFRLSFFDRFPSLERFHGNKDGLPADGLARPLKYKSRVLFGTTDGLYWFKDKEQVRRELPDSLKNDPEYYKGMFKEYKLHEKFYTDQILYLQNGDKKEWICINNQIGYLDKKNDFQLIERPFWGIDLGRINTFYLEKNGDLWAGAADGMIRYHPGKNKNYKSDFQSLIRRVHIPDTTLYLGTFAGENGGFLRLEQNQIDIVSIPFKDNDITIHFAAPYFEDDHKPVYSYKLKGYEENWSIYQPTSWAKYTNLDEGTYTLLIKAKNVYGQKSSTAKYKFRILAPWYRTTWAYITYIFLLLIIIFISIKIASYRLKKKNQWLEQVVDERTKEIQTKNNVLEQQKEEILYQKEEIEDSINYAQRIQNAILPLQKEIQDGLNDVFVLFKPKHIVSGDFYWYSKIGDEHVFVCADCTGHGVPGAFMSMICSDKLNQTIKEQRITAPNNILHEANKGIKKALKQTEEGDRTRDGMDCAVITINFEKKTMKYSGANRPIWLIRDGELHETKATKVAVGGPTPMDQQYKIEEFDLKKGDQIYLSSDGYADQFGGEKSKKMKVKKFKNKILEIKKMEMEKQDVVLNDFFEEWRGDQEQVDDVCVFGIRI